MAIFVQIEELWRRAHATAGECVVRYLAKIRPPEPPRPIADVRVPLTLDQQWSKLEAGLLSHISRSDAVLQMQGTAARHLDAAQYALGRIAIELTGVMPAITEVATVHTMSASHSVVRSATRQQTGDVQPLAA